MLPYRFRSLCTHIRHVLQTVVRRIKGKALLAAPLIAAFILLSFSYSKVSATTFQNQRTQHEYHALLVSSQPAADAVLQSPPTVVQMMFSETLIPTTSQALVVDTTNRQVNMKDGRVTENNGNEMNVALPILRAGTYVVVWRTQSAIDGHIASGSFLFRIAHPDGSIPPIPAVLPHGHIPGAGGIGAQSSTTMDGPILLQAIATWLSLLFVTFWAGGTIWETWVFPIERHATSDHSTAIGQASQCWRRYTPSLLIGILLANSGIISGQAAELAGDWSGCISLPLLHAILFESHFGAFWLLKEGITLCALLFLMLLSRKQRSIQALLRSRKEGDPGKLPDADPLQNTDMEGDLSQNICFYGRSEFIRTLKGIPHLPAHLIEGIRQRSWSGRLECGLSFLLLFVFALSGHAAAISSSALWAIIGIDLFHLLANAAWVGGLLYIGIVLLPILNRQSNSDWASVLAIGLPKFSVIAITSVILLTATGSFNTTVHLTSFPQFWTTAYGRILTVKIGIFVLMMGISSYHAFFLRPHLMYALTTTKETKEMLLSKGIKATTKILCLQCTPSSLTHEETISPHALILGKRLERWLRLEGILGASLLLCVALLATFAGSLSNSTTVPTMLAQRVGPVIRTETTNDYTIILKITPATFGTNMFFVSIKNAQGRPVTGAAVLIDTTMLDMDMGTEATQLHANPKQPGMYTQHADLTMAGHWEIGVRILPADSNNFIKVLFHFSVS